MKAAPPFLPAVQQLRDELCAAETVKQAKDVELGELRVELAWTRAWGNDMYERAWKAELDLDDCESELCIVKLELAECRRKLRDSERLLELTRLVHAEALARDNSPAARPSRLPTSGCLTVVGFEVAEPASEPKPAPKPPMPSRVASWSDS